MKTTREDEANSILSRVERRLKLIEAGDLLLLADADVMVFLISDGKLQQPVIIPTLTIHDLLTHYKDSLCAGTMEANSIATINLHLSHIERHVDSQLRVDAFKFQQLQDYADNRSEEKGQRGRPVSPVTIKNELTSLSGAWNWGAGSALKKHPPSNRLMVLSPAEFTLPILSSNRRRGHYRLATSTAPDQDVRMPEVRRLLSGS